MRDNCPLKSVRSLERVQRHVDRLMMLGHDRRLVNDRRPLSASQLSFCQPGITSVPPDIELEILGHGLIDDGDVAIVALEPLPPPRPSDLHEHVIGQADADHRSHFARLGLSRCSD